MGREGYLFLNREMSWESDFSFRKEKYGGFEDEGWYIAAEISTLDDLIRELENAGFDGEYIDNFIEIDLSHDDYNALTQKEDIKICEVVLILREYGINKSIEELTAIAKEIVNSIAV